MPITIRIPSRLQTSTEQQALITIHSASNLLEALLKLASYFPDIRGHLFATDERLNPYIRLSVNDTLVSDLTTPLSDNSDIIIFTAIAGG